MKYFTKSTLGMVNLKRGNVDSCCGVLVVDNLDISLAPHDDGTLGVDGVRDKLDDPLNLSFEHTSGRDPTSLFNNHSHWNTFVEKTELTLR